MSTATLNASDEPERNEPEEARQEALGQIAAALSKLGHPASTAAEIAELRRSVDSLRDRIERGTGCHHYGSCCHGYFRYYPYTYTSVAAGGYVGNTYTIAAGGTTYPAATTTVTYPTVTTTNLTTWNTGGGGGGGYTYDGL